MQLGVLMKLINNSYKNELQLVNKLIKSEVINETVIQQLYDYIFKKNGKQLRPLLSLIASSTDKRKTSKRVRYNVKRSNRIFKKKNHEVRKRFKKRCYGSSRRF